MSKQIDLEGMTETAKFLDKRDNETNIYAGIEALRGILPIVVAAGEQEDSELIMAGITISYTINRLDRVWKELVRQPS